RSSRRPRRRHILGTATMADGGVKDLPGGQPDFDVHGTHRWYEPGAETPQRSTGGSRGPLTACARCLPHWRSLLNHLFSRDLLKKPVRDVAGAGQSRAEYKGEDQTELRKQSHGSSANVRPAFGAGVLTMLRQLGSRRSQETPPPQRSES